MTLIECIEAYKSFQKLSDLGLPISSSFMIAQNINKLESVVKAFEQTRQQYIQELQTKAVENEQGELELPDELAAAFKKDIESLLQEKQSIRLKKVKIVDTGQLSIEPRALAGCIDYLILEDGDSGK